MHCASDWCLSECQLCLCKSAVTADNFSAALGDVSAGVDATARSSAGQQRDPLSDVLSAVLSHAVYERLKTDVGRCHATVTQLSSVLAAQVSQA